MRIDLDGSSCRTIAVEQTSRVAGEAALDQRLAEVDPSLATCPDVGMRGVGRRLELAKSPGNLALDVAFRAVQHRRVNRDDDRTLNSLNLPGNRLHVGDFGREALAPQTVRGIPGQPADAALLLRRPGKVKADEGGHSLPTARGLGVVAEGTVSPGEGSFEPSSRIRRDHS